MTTCATRWYATRSAVKVAATLAGISFDSYIDQKIEAATEHIENILKRRFIPETATKYFPWPTRDARGGYILMLPDYDLLAVSALQTKAQDTTPTTIAAADYFLEPVNDPPYHEIQIDLSSNAAFEAGDTSQRSIGVTGRWAYCETTKAAGALAEADDGAETELDVTDSSLIDVGNTILIGTEAMFVTAKALKDTTADIAADLTASAAATGVTVTDGSLIKQGEVVTIDSERMLVESISGNALTVVRAYDGSVLATHASAPVPASVYAPRTLTVVRAVNGTTAAAHNNAAAITKYAPPADVVAYCEAYAIALHQQGRAGWTGIIGDGGVTGVESRMIGLRSMEADLIRKYRRVTV